jgi:hypothetical protein
MAEIHFDSDLPDQERRMRLYAGGIFMFSPTTTTLEFCEFAAELIRDAYGSLDPETAQDHLPVEDSVAILKELKPRFIHHPRSKEFVEAILRERGGDPEDTYYDVPRMRSSTSGGYLTSGIAYAWHPHRDTWYSAPLTQVNWWLPIFPIAQSNCMSFFPEYFSRAVPNDSAKYDYAEWNAKHRFAAADNVVKDERPLPGPEQPIPKSAEVPIVCPPGGLIVFSGAQLHASVQNTSGRTRFSIDFRSLSLQDCRTGTAAPNVDVFCTGTSIGDFHRVADRAAVPADLAAALSSQAVSA